MGLLGMKQTAKAYICKHTTERGSCTPNYSAFEAHRKQDTCFPGKEGPDASWHGGSCQSRCWKQHLGGGHCQIVWRLERAMLSLCSKELTFFSLVVIPGEAAL